MKKQKQWPVTLPLVKSTSPPTQWHHVNSQDGFNLLLNNVSNGQSQFVEIFPSVLYSATNKHCRSPFFNSLALNKK